MNQPTAASRIQSIDILRGIVMIIMALDHVRDFLHVDAFQHDPLNPDTTTPILFFTRFITHYCAPVFVFLSGASAYLSGLKKTKAEHSRFLLTRGLWLIFAEVAIITLALTLNPLYNFLFLQVIWAIGISMVILSMLIWLPVRVIFIIGLLIVFGHNLLDFPEAARGNKVNIFWDFAHNVQLSIYPLGNNHFLGIAYAFLPWTGIMLTGYGVGQLFAPAFDAARRRKILSIAGLSLIVLFIALRLINVYGDRVPWMPHATGLQTFLAFMNVTKYPPSLQYVGITLGPALLLLSRLELVTNAFTRFVSVYGRVPFFYYVLHFYLIRIISVIAFFATGYGVKDIITPNFPFLFRPLQFGFPLCVVYLVWVAVVLLLYPLCKRFDLYKRTHKKWWLSYL
ncbi:MAG: heparan-alpha-glucosaminide N-acetyltransferase domain-containing protein [Chitinophagaceae bacterium]